MWLMQLYPSVTNIHINIVDVLIAIVYCSDQQVLTAFFTNTWILKMVYEAVSNPSISPLKSQLKIFLQAIASCCQYNNKTLLQEAGGREKNSRAANSIVSILMGCPYFRKIIEIEDIFHIFEPLAAIGMENVVMPYKGSKASKGCKASKASTK